MTIKKAILLDLEGTLYTREGVIDGAQAAIGQLRAEGHVLRFMTNTDSQSTGQLHALLLARGLRVAMDELFTPVVAAKAMLRGKPDVRATVLATEAVEAELADDIKIVSPDDNPTHVVLGDLRERLTYNLLDAAFTALIRGAQLIALQKGRLFLVDGSAHIDTGALVAALEYAAGLNARVVGKPSAEFVRLALRGESPIAFPNDVWVIGDDVYSDVAMGLNVGARTVLVRTGKYALHSTDAAAPKADCIVDSIRDVPSLLIGAHVL